MAEKETIKSAFFIGYVVMQVDYDLIMQIKGSDTDDDIYDHDHDDDNDNYVDNGDADVYETSCTQVPGGWLAEMFGTKRVFGFCT